MADDKPTPAVDADAAAINAASCGAVVARARAMSSRSV
jgi:hypothetical protein